VVLGARFQAISQQLLTRLNIATAFDAATATRTIEALDARSSHGGSGPQHVPQFRIIVIDTVTALLGPRLSNLSSQGTFLTGSQSHIKLMTDRPTRLY
jgi:hypothetical protein